MYLQISQGPTNLNQSQDFYQSIYQSIKWSKLFLSRPVTRNIQAYFFLHISIGLRKIRTINREKWLFKVQNIINIISNILEKNEKFVQFKQVTQPPKKLNQCFRKINEITVIKCSYALHITQMLCLWSKLASTLEYRPENLDRTEYDLENLDWTFFATL